MPVEVVHRNAWIATSPDKALAPVTCPASLMAAGPPSTFTPATARSMCWPSVAMMPATRGRSFLLRVEDWAAASAAAASDTDPTSSVTGLQLSSGAKANTPLQAIRCEAADRIWPVER